MKSYKKLARFFALVALCTTPSCGTETGNGRVEIRYGAYSPTAWYSFLIPSAHADVSSLTLCFKRLRFLADDVDVENPDQSPANITFEIGEVTFSAAGGSLGTISLPTGNYKRLDIDLHDSCGTSRSVRFINGATTYTTNKQITLKFRGSFTAAEGEQRLTLVLEDLISKLNTVSSDDEIKTKLQNANGTF